MKSKLTFVGSLAVVLLLFLAVGLTQAQGPEPPGEGMQPQADVGVHAAVSARIPIQGRLTDSSGNPLNGNYSITASIYNVSSGGTALCSDTQTVAVNNGLFTMNMRYCTSDDINGRQLYLGIKVGTDAEMTPRQAIYPVPYAFSLMPGALISNTMSGTPLKVYNHGTGWGLDVYSDGHDAVHGRTGSSDHAGVAGVSWGSGIGVYGESNSGIAIMAGGNGVIKSTALTSWAVSPLKMVRGDYGSNWNDLQIIPSAQFGYVKLYTTGQDDLQALLPVDMPYYLFGTYVNLSSYLFCYKMDNTADKITQVDVEYVGTDGSAHNLCSYTTDVSSISWACRTCTPTSYAGILGPVFVRFSLHFDADGSGRGIRLGQMYLNLAE